MTDDHATFLSGAGPDALSAADRLARSDAAPLYHQVAGELRRMIESGRLRPGDRLPSIERLMDEFGVGRATVREAVRRLRDDGLLLPERGRGTLVTERAAERRTLRVETTFAALVDTYRGDRPDLETLDDGPSKPDADPSEGRLAEAYHNIRRVHTRDGVRYCVISLHIERGLFRRAEPRFRAELALPVLVDLGVDIARARQSVTIESCDPSTAAALGYPYGAPIARVRRVLADSEGDILYLADVLYRGDSVRFEMDLRP
jgi:GntR family transcriptional regulator